MPNRILLQLVLLSLQMHTGHLAAQWRGPALTRLGPEEGLPAMINNIAQDSTGYLYFATNTGMYQYDGHTMSFYGHDPHKPESIGAGYIYNMHASSDGLIWLTSDFGGLSNFNPSTGKFKHYPTPKLSFRNIPGVNGLLEDADGTIWVGGHHFQLLAFDKKKEQYTAYSPSWVDAPNDRRRLAILSITQDVHQENILWLSVLSYGVPQSGFNSYRLVSFNKQTKSFTDYACYGQTRYQEPDGVLWGTYWGNFITRFDPRSLSCDTFQYRYAYKNKVMNSVSQDIIRYHDQLYVTTAKALLTLNANHTFELISQPELEEEQFLSLFTDRDDHLWIGTNQGAYALNPDHQLIRYFSIEQFGESGRIFPGRLAYHIPTDAIYLSHTGNPSKKGYYVIPLAENKKKEAQFYPTAFHVEGLACDAQNRIWLAGNGAFHLIDPESHVMKSTNLIPSGDRPISFIQNIKSGAEGWIGAISHAEFSWFHSDKQMLKRISVKNLPGSAYAKSFDDGFDGFSFAKNNKAFLFSNQIHRLDLETGIPTVLAYDPLINPHNQRFLYVAEDDAGYVWISTFVHIGKFKLEKDSLILMESFGVNDGMISPTASELHIDSKGRVWVFTGSGMNCIDPDTREVRFFGTKEGLPFPFIDPRQVLNISGDRIATVCGSGLIIFPVESLWNAVAPSNESVVFKNIRVDGKQLMMDGSLNELKQLELKRGNRGADIEFQALAYPTDYRMEYSYRITGLQDEWISLGQNKLVTLPSLKPGKYSFEVKVGKPDSHAPVKSLQIIVPTPLFQKLWFILLALGLFIATVYLVIRYRIRTIRDQETERTEINKQIAELELKALRSQMNPHFMFNSLNSIKNYILHAEPKLAAEYLSNFAHLIRMILQNSREKSITLQEELDTLILYIELEQIRFDHKFELSCEIGKDVHLEQVMIPPMLLQPFVENAIWHGLMHKKSNGHLTLSFIKTDEMIACIIDDDGVGRSKSAEMKSHTSTKYKSMGMGITLDRIEIMNKMDALGISVEIADKQDHTGQPSGTRVIVNIPAPMGN